MNDNFDYIKKQVQEIESMFGENISEEIDYKSILKETGIDLDDLENEINEYSQKRELSFKTIHPDAVHPKYNYETDSGFDLHSVEESTLKPFGRMLIPTGLCFDIPDGYEIQVRPKSGLAINQGLTVLNTPGTADCGYTGEIKVIVFNTNPYEVIIPKGMKVAQAVLCPVVNGKWVELIKVDEINSKDRGSAGFGSTGIL